MATKVDVVRIARQAVAQRLAGDTSWEHNGVKFDLDAGGYCARFVRQCHDAALGQGEMVWAYKSPTAWDMEIVLRAAGLRTSNPQPGDILCINGAGCRPGHIGIYLGNGEYAENTSSSTRGNPRAAGTKISPISAVADRVTGYYAALPGAQLDQYSPGPWTISLPGAGKMDGWMTQGEDGHLVGSVRTIVEAMHGSLVTYPERRTSVVVMGGGKLS
jgi:hypothetical protein